MSCNCSRPHWTSEELLEKADILSTLLMNNPNVTGVAVTGSVARGERDVHDLDLVVFHNGRLPTGGFRQTNGIDEVGNRWDISANDIGMDLVRRLQTVRRGVPVTYLFVNEVVLWKCTELQALGRQEIHPGFWRTVFCQIPLLLFPECRGFGLKKFTAFLPPWVMWRDLLVPLIPLRHHCGSPECEPVSTWEWVEECIKERKAGRERAMLSSNGSGEGEDDS